MPRVSILIPAYNAMKYLPDTLESVFRQTYQDYDVLIINDGSTDTIVDWIQEISDPRVRLVTINNQGLAAARNTGIPRLTSEYVALLDADDLWEPTKLEKQVKLLDAEPSVGLVYTWMVLADSEGEPTGRIIKSDPKEDAWRQLIECNIVGSGSTPVIRRSCFDTVGLFATDVSGSDDWDMWLRIARHYDFAVVKEPLVRYRQSETAMSRDYFLMLETSRTLIERAFSDMPTELLHLKNHSYSSTYLYLGWRALESRNLIQAKSFVQQAIYHRPQLWHFQGFLRLKFAIMVMTLIGAQRYETFLRLIKKIRGRFFHANHSPSRSEILQPQSE